MMGKLLWGYRAYEEHQDRPNSWTSQHGSYEALERALKEYPFLLSKSYCMGGKEHGDILWSHTGWIERIKKGEYLGLGRDTAYISLEDGEAPLDKSQAIDPDSLFGTPEDYYFVVDDSGKVWVCVFGQTPRQLIVRENITPKWIIYRLVREIDPMSVDIYKVEGA